MNNPVFYDVTCPFCDTPQTLQRQETGEFICEACGLPFDESNLRADDYFSGDAVREIKF